MKTSSFSIYNASAGSGKTFTLVKAYINKILLSNKPDYFKTILAVTFTNKAVGEMKERILKNLQEFANEKILDTPSDMFRAVENETKLDPKEIHKRAQRAVNYILHNYGSFDVETIDRFNHRLIRAFAKDLKIASNFEVELDVDSLLTEAVDRVINLAGKDEKLTKVILDFTFEKAEDDKSWDITFDLNEISKLLKNENDLIPIDRLKTKTIADFLNLKKTVYSALENTSKALVELAENCIDVILKNGLEFSDFNSSYFPKYLEKIANKDFSVNTDLKWQASIGTEPMYPKRVIGITASTIDRLTETFSIYFQQSKTLLIKYSFLKTIQNNINSLSLLNAIYREFKELQQEKNLVPISEFNARIFKEIKGQPAPFIYERLGDKYKHFFIDEFQDTSQMQWLNLVPLIDNALSQENLSGETGSLLIVGDAKQSIYRWRGGYPEQFIALSNEENPFFLENINSQTLKTNFRSYDQIITFNNAFFQFTSTALHSETHLQLYKDGNKQEANTKKGGYVSISFIEAENKTEAFQIYPEKVLEIVVSQINKGFKLKDICILTRKRSQGVAIATKLSENNIPILSSEALLLSNSSHIQFIIGVLGLVDDFEDRACKADVLYFLHDYLNSKDEKHSFINKFLNATPSEFSAKLKLYAIRFDFDFLSTLPLYEICEYICATFGLSKAAVAYVQSFLDVILEFSSKNQGDLTSFLEHWENKKDTLSIETSENLDAVKIMTIHKAKGLQFPVVIYPFADDILFDSKRKKVWFPLPPEEFNGFSEILIPFSKNIENFGGTGATIYNEQKSQEEFDSMNVVYVALTRAVEQVFVVSNHNIAKREGTVAYLFSNYLSNLGLWNENEKEYTFGSPERNAISIEKKGETETIVLNDLVSSDKNKNNIFVATNSGLLWDTAKEKAIEKGNLMHLILSEIATKSDVSGAIKKYQSLGMIHPSQSEILINSIDELINHHDLKTYFQANAIVELERDIYTKEGLIFRPDRLNFLENNRVTIIDYKTGEISISHKQQLSIYESPLLEMGYFIAEKILVYINDSIIVVKI